jgi:hypothetical protein
MPIVFKFCMFAVLLTVAMDRPSRLHAMAVVVVAVVCLMAWHALLQTHRGWGFGPWTPPLYIGRKGLPGYTRTYWFGIFSDPNDLAQILATGLPFAFALPRRRSIVGFLFSCAVAWLLVEAVLTTHSRGGLVALAACGAMMLGLVLPARLQRWYLFLMVLGFLAMCPLSRKLLDSSARDRVVFWGQANRMFKRYPLFGIGVNMISEYTEEGRAVHNAFVLCYTEIGLFGYWFWFSLLQLGLMGCWAARAALRRPKTPAQAWLRRFAGLSVCATVGYAASAYFLSRAFVYPVYILFAILAAVPLVTQRLLGPDAPRLINVRRDLFLWCTAGSLFSVAYIYVSILFLNRAYMGG